MSSRIVAVVGLLVLSVSAPWSLGGEAVPGAPTPAAPAPAAPAPAAPAPAAPAPAAVPVPAAPPTPIDVNTVREKASPGACQVTVLNSWGLPVAYVNGFLLGQGRFVVTDLGAVGQPGVTSVGLKFWNGTAATAKEFGLADASTGLVALKIDAESPVPGGLDLASDAPPVSALPTTATVGWPWSKEFGVGPGHLSPAPPAKDLAQRCGITAPEGPDTFLRVEGLRFDAASGAPIVNAQGAVVAVRTDLAARGLALVLAAPAAPFRATLLSAPPQVKPLAELPKPVWPVRLLRLPGEPPAPAEFAKAVAAVKTAMICPTCNGKPTRGFGFGGPGGGPGDWGTCRTCRGEGIAFSAQTKTVLSEVALNGTRGQWAPVADEKPRTAIRATAHEVLKVLTLAAQGFQTSMATGFWQDMDQWAANTMPRGGVFYGEVRETIDGPDGKYVLIRPNRARDVVAVRLDLLLEATTKAGAGTKELIPGMQVALLGAAVGRFRTPSGERAFYVLPLDWMPTPGLTISMPDYFGPPGDPRGDRGPRDRGSDRGGDRGGDRGNRPPDRPRPQLPPGGVPVAPPGGGNNP